MSTREGLSLNISTIETRWAAPAAAVRGDFDGALDRLPGERLVPFSHRFRHLARIGKGAQGVVHLCRDRRDPGRRVIVKIARPGSDARELIEREANVLRALRGCFAVPELQSVIYRHGLLSGFVTRYIAGETLDHHLRHGRLNRRRVRTLSVAISEAVLEVLHRGFLHRDIKPENLLVGRHRNVQILDFGLACQLRNLPPDGEISGTFAYASPEQLRARPILPASDLFSLGLILYEVATGDMFFSSDLGNFPAFMAYRARRLRETLYLDAVERPLATLIRRLLVVDPRERASLREVAERVERLRRKSSRIRRRRLAESAS